MTSVVWFKRDLRTRDHAALSAACEAGPVIALYLVEPEYWALPDTSARQWAFTAECLESLREELDLPLVIRVGNVLDVFEGIKAETSFSGLYSHEETGNAWTYARDVRVRDWCAVRGIAWHEFAQSGVVRRLRGRDGWAARRERFIRQPVIPHNIRPHTQHGPVAGPGATLAAIPTAADLRMAPDPCPGRQRGGRAEAMALLGGFLSERGRTYRKAMSSPVEGEWACSRLSPYLALGVLSGREAAQAAAGRKAEILAGARDGWKGSLTSFTSRLAWRDHFMQKLEDEPRIETECLHRGYADLRVGSDRERLAAWAAGQTGLPFVDACMRFLRHTGWLNFRMRSMLMAVASYHLWLDWRDSGLILARLFTDYEPGIHWSQTQMQSGTTGMNTLRIYNPVKQGKDQDPSGAFTRKWVPEIAALDDAHLQEPWRAGGVAGYPAPIVDVAKAARAARERVFAVRRGQAFREEADEIVKKHASRKKDRGFQRDPMPKEPMGPKDAGGPEQMSFDL